MAVVCAMALSKPAVSAETPVLRADIPYGPNLGQHDSNLLDVYAPPDAEPGSLPVVIWIHGGGWFKGDKSSPHISRKARTLIRAGYVFVSVNYRLSPEFRGGASLWPGRFRFPVAHNDAARAIGWVDRNIARYGGDPNQLILGGESAGGQMSSLIATRPSFLVENGVSPGQVKAVLSLDGVGFDIQGLLDPIHRERQRGLARLMFNAFGSADEERRDPRWAAASPINFADPQDPPIFHVVPANGVERWVEAKQMSDRLGQRFELVSMRVNTSHDGVSAMFGSPDDRGLTGRVLAFFKAALEPTRSVPVIQGRRVVRTADVRKSAFPGRSGARPAMGTFRLRITSRPEARQITCRMDAGPETSCRRVWRLATGLHELRVTTYGADGKPSAIRSEQLLVTR